MAQMERIKPFDAQHLQSIAKILADTVDGLMGSQIEYLLADAKIPDVSPSMTKWKRLFNAFVSIQNDKKIGNYVVMFINRAMQPVQYTKAPRNVQLPSRPTQRRARIFRHACWRRWKSAPRRPR